MTPTILVVEDEPDLAATCQRLLSRRGWRDLVQTIAGNPAGLFPPSAES